MGGGEGDSNDGSSGDGGGSANDGAGGKGDGRGSNGGGEGRGSSGGDGTPHVIELQVLVTYGGVGEAGAGAKAALVHAVPSGGAGAGGVGVQRLCGGPW